MSGWTSCPHFAWPNISGFFHNGFEEQALRPTFSKIAPLSHSVNQVSPFNSKPDLFRPERPPQILEDRLRFWAFVPEKKKRTALFWPLFFGRSTRVKTQNKALQLQPKQGAPSKGFRGLDVDTSFGKEAFLSFSSPHKAEGWPWRSTGEIVIVSQKKNVKFQLNTKKKYVDMARSWDNYEICQWKKIIGYWTHQEWPNYPQSWTNIPSNPGTSAWKSIVKYQQISSFNRTMWHMVSYGSVWYGMVEHSLVSGYAMCMFTM